jgi:uncharacterized protein (DUF1697 family)
VTSSEPLTTYVAFLRGINVGRAKQVAMAELREAVTAAGYQDVRTLLRSGNVVLRGSGSQASVARDLEGVIHERFGMTVTVVVRTADELSTVIANNPLDDRTADGSRLHVMLLGRALSADERGRLDEEDFGADLVRPAAREIYAWYAAGMSGSDTATRLARLVTTPNTDRNWNTILRTRAMTEASGSPFRRGE